MFDDEGLDEEADECQTLPISKACNFNRSLWPPLACSKKTLCCIENDLKLEIIEVI